MELELKNVSKEFKGVHAVSDVSVSMRKGVYGLLGVNGAGKTTLMRSEEHTSELQSLYS